MDFEYTFDRYRLIIRFRSEVSPESFRLKVADDRFEFEFQDHSSQRHFSLRLDALLAVEGFDCAYFDYLRQDGQHALIAVNDSGVPLDELIIKSQEDFWKRVNSPARVIKNQFILRHCCKRAVARYSNDFNVLGASLCALGYRILDLEEESDEDMAWLDLHTQKLFSWLELVDSGDEARWVSSVAILNAYKELNAGQHDAADAFLEKCLHYRNMVKYRPMIQINIARAFFLLAHSKVKRGLFRDAVDLFKQVDRVAIEGVVFSDLSAPSAGRHKFSEFIACLRAVRESRIAIRELEKLIDLQKNVGSRYSVAALSGYVNTLARRGRI